MQGKKLQKMILFLNIKKTADFLAVFLLSKLLLT